MPEYDFTPMTNYMARGVDDRQREERNALAQDADQFAFDAVKQDRETSEMMRVAQIGAGATRYMLDKPDAVPAVMPKLVEAGILPPDYDWQQQDPNELMAEIEEAHHGFMGQLGGGQQAAPDEKPIKAADGRYRYPSSGQLAFPDVEPVQDVSQAREDVEWLKGATPEERDLYFAAKRGEKGASAALEKRLYEVNDRGFKASQNVGRYNRLADELIRVDPASGKYAEWTETYKALTGQEDAVTLLRKQWNELMVGAAIQNLPPGVASDKDIELVMSAFLPEFADPETIASFMRGMAKVEQLNADYADFESAYLSKNLTPLGMKEAWAEYAKEKYGDDGDAPAANARPAPEGTIVTDESGRTYIKQGGNWVLQQ